MADKDQESVLASVPELPPEPREDLVSTAVNFLLNPKVRPNSLVQKKAFLKKKGLTDEEIELAIDRSGTRNDASTVSTVAPSAQSQALVTHQPPPAPVSPWSRSRDYLATAIVIGGVSYGLYQFVKKYLYPYLYGPSEEEKRAIALQQSITDLNQNVAQVLVGIQEMQKSLQQQQEQIKDIVKDASLNRGPDEMRWMQDSRTVSEIKTEILSLKGLLLNRKQFPSTPISKPVLPSWQLESTKQDDSSSDTNPTTTNDASTASSVSMATDNQNPEAGDNSMSASVTSKPQDQSDMVNGEVAEDVLPSGDGQGQIKVESSPEEVISSDTVETRESPAEDVVENASSPVIA